MAFSKDQKVRVVDQSSGYRNHRGVVQSVSGDNHNVRLDGFACGGTVLLLTEQLQADATTHTVDYSQCVG